MKRFLATLLACVLVLMSVTIAEESNLETEIDLLEIGMDDADQEYSIDIADLIVEEESETEISDLQVINEPFNQSIQIGDVVISVAALEGSFPNDATLKVELIDQSEQIDHVVEESIINAVEIALSLDGIVTHQLYRIEILDGSHNPSMPSYEMPLPEVSVTGLNTACNLRVAAWDYMDKTANELKTDQESDTLVFNFIDSTIYDFVMLEEMPVASNDGFITIEEQSTEQSKEIEELKLEDDQLEPDEDRPAEIEFIGEQTDKDELIDEETVKALPEELVDQIVEEQIEGNVEQFEKEQTEEPEDEQTTEELPADVQLTVKTLVDAHAIIDEMEEPVSLPTAGETDETIEQLAQLQAEEPIDQIVEEQIEEAVEQFEKEQTEEPEDAQTTSELPADAQLTGETLADIHTVIDEIEEAENLPVNGQADESNGDFTTEKPEEAAGESENKQIEENTEQSVTENAEENSVLQSTVEVHDDKQLTEKALTEVQPSTDEAKEPARQPDEEQIDAAEQPAEKQIEDAIQQHEDELAEEPVEQPVENSTEQPVDSISEAGSFEDVSVENSQTVDVVFDIIPATADVVVYQAPTEEASDLIAIPAREDGSFQLLPGEYVYTAIAEGYVVIEKVPFTAAGKSLTISFIMQPEEREEAGFDQSMVVDGVIINVKANSGVFPADAALSVETVPVYQQQQANAAADEVRDEKQNLAASYSFDVKIINSETGEEYQPAEGETVNVSFTLAEVADTNLKTQVYHITEGEPGTGEMSAEKMDVCTEDRSTVVVETDGFSIYTVDLTYNDLQYAFPGDKEVALADILDAVGLSGDVTEVHVSDDSLFSVVKNENGEWFVTAHRPFDTSEWMKVRINDVLYEITVTDSNGINPSGLYGVWVGTYSGVVNGDTIDRTLRLDIDYSVEGNIEGIATIDGGDNGSYFFDGTVDLQNGNIELKGTDWINNPAGFTFSSFSGEYLENENTIQGIVDGENTRNFSLSKESDSYSSRRIDIQDIPKDWKGEYDGHHGDRTVVRRDYEVHISSIDADGSITGIAIVAPSDKADPSLGANGSYYFDGAIDSRRGKIWLQGNEWIEYPISSSSAYSDWSFVALEGFFDLSLSSVSGKSEDGIWEMKAIDYGSIQALSGFTLGKNNNNFHHYNASDEVHDGFSGIKNYYIFEQYFRTLTRNSDKGEIAKIEKEMWEKWEGSCYGISMSMGLLYEGLIDASDLTNSGQKDYYNFNYPYEDSKLLNMINYYHLSQFLKRGGWKSSAISTVYGGSKDTAWVINLIFGGDSLPVFLKRLVEYCESDHVELFSYAFPASSGHAVLITGCKYIQSINEYMVEIYDMNSVKSKGDKGRFTHMFIKKDFSGFEYTTPEGSKLTEKSFGRMSFLDLRSVGNVTSANSKKYKGHTQIDFPAGEQFKLTDKSGNSLVYDGNRLSGDIPVYWLDMVDYGDGSRVIIEIADTEDLTLTDIGNTIDVDVMTDESFMGVSGTSIDEATFDMQEGVKLQGNDMDYKVYMTTRKESVNESGLISLSGSSKSELEVSVEDAGLSVKTDELLSDIETESYAGSSVTKRQYTNITSEFSIDDDAKVTDSTVHVHTPVTDAAIPATCTTSGLTEGSHCATCGEVLAAQQPIAALPHTPVADPAVAATYTAAGLTEGSHCAVCGTVLVAQQPVAALGYPQIALEKVKNNGTVTINVGDIRQIVPTFATASGLTVTGYKSSKAKVASVDGNGLLTANAEGKAKITVTTNEKKKATLTVKVVDPYKPTGISIAQGKAVTITMGQSLQLGVNLTPATARATLTWASNKPKVATVDGNGLVTTVGEGKAKITVRTQNKKKTTITVQVVDPYKPTAIAIAQGKAVTITMGQPLQLNVGLAPESARATLTWASNKPGVATVDGNGLVTPQGEGKAKITVSTHNKKKATITVQVVDPNKPLGIAIAQGKKITMKVGETLQLSVGLNPETAQSALTWKTNKPAIAGVDANGIVTAVKKGKAKITVMTYNKKKATITVNVVE